MNNNWYAMQEIQRIRHRDLMVEAENQRRIHQAQVARMNVLENMKTWVSRFSVMWNQKPVTVPHIEEGQCCPA